METPSLQVFKSCVDVKLFIWGCGSLVSVLACGQILKDGDAIALNDAMKYLEFQLG